MTTRRRAIRGGRRAGGGGAGAPSTATPGRGTGAAASTAPGSGTTDSPLALTPLGRATAGARRIRISRDTWIALAIGTLAASVYLFTSSRDRENLDYFVRLAAAFLDGRVHLTEAPSWLTELIPRDGVWYVAYPPMPAVMLVPFVVLLGTELHQQVASALFGGVAVGLTYLVLCRFELAERVRLLLALVFAFGTCFFYVAETGNTWYLSHVVAVLFATAAILLALHRRWPLVVGLLLGLAVLSRLPVVLTAPFYAAMLVGLGWPIRMPVDRRGALGSIALFGAGLAIPLALLAAYNVARFDSPFELGYALIPGVLDEPYYQEGIFSVSYIPRHVYALFFRSWNWSDAFPWATPSWWGLAILLTTPLFLWLVKARIRDPRVLYAAVAVAVALVPLVTHGNVGFTQFGYRFSLDVQPLLFVVLATVFERGMSRLAVAAALLSIAFSTYGVWAIGAGYVSF
jgi:hypothetical protein